MGYAVKVVGGGDESGLHGNYHNQSFPSGAGSSS